MSNNHYDTLGVEQSATAAEIKQAYRRRVREHHEAKGGDQQEMARVNVAYETLLDKARRAEYDALLTNNPAYARRVAGFKYVMAEYLLGPDPVSMTRLSVLVAKREAKAMMAEVKVVIAKLEKNLSRIKTKNSNRNLAEELTQDALKVSREKLEELKEVVGDSEAILSMLDDYYVEQEMRLR